MNDHGYRRNFPNSKINFIKPFLLQEKQPPGCFSSVCSLNLCRLLIFCRNAGKMARVSLQKDTRLQGSKTPNIQTDKKCTNLYFSDKPGTCMQKLDMISTFCDSTPVSQFHRHVHGNFCNSSESQQSMHNFPSENRKPITKEIYVQIRNTLKLELCRCPTEGNLIGQCSSMS